MSQIKLSLQQAAQDYVYKYDKEEATPNSYHCGESFKAGAAFVLPLLQKVIEQRDEILLFHKQLLDNNNILTPDGFKLDFNDNIIKEYNDELNGVTDEPN